MIEIDGSYGEGGGQIIRTAVALSAITEKPVRITNIRAGRNPPGLKHQHILAIKGIQKLANAEVQGLKLGSTEIVFEPGEIKGGRIKLEIPTAGSVGLVLQPILIAGAFSSKPTFLEISGGGTWVKWAPPVKYLEKVFIPFLERFGLKSRINQELPGFYPEGGARVRARVDPSELEPILVDSDNPRMEEIEILAEGSKSLKKRKVLERMVKTARDTLFEKTGIPPNSSLQYYETRSSGCGILVVFKGKGIFGRSGLCEIGVRSEDIGRSVTEVPKDGAVDRYLGDQIVPFIALFGGSVNVEEVTNHLKTNVWVCNKFLPGSIKLEGKRVIGSKQV